jgi:DNA-binding transcriptional regulator YiaG
VACLTGTGKEEEMTDIPATVTGLELRVARVRRRLRQFDLAKLVDVPPQRISDFETEVRRPTPAQLRKLWEVLGGVEPCSEGAV